MSKIRPPQFFVTFFLWYCNPRLQETILGDLEEQFEEDLENYGSSKARRKFAWNVARFFRPGIIKTVNRGQKINYHGMIKNDFKTAFRVIKREKLYSGINILGLTSGFVIALLILFYVRFEQGYERYNPNADKVVRITMDYLDGETPIDQDCETYHNLGPMITDEFPEIEGYARVFGLEEILMEIDDQFFRESKVYAVDHDFLSLFGYPLLYGDLEGALHKPNQVVLTESTAIKYFGNINPVGKSISLNENTPIKVVGVIADNPASTHLKFDLLFSYSTMKKMLAKRKSVWSSNDTFTYLKLSSPDRYPLFQENLARLSARLTAEDHLSDERIVSQKIEDIHLYSHKSYEAEQNGSSSLVLFLFGVALLVILIAIVNYINLSTVKSMDRAKEVGIRKVIGSSKSQLRIRFFLESIIINLIAGLASVVLILIVFDSFKALADLPESIQILNDWSTWKLLGLLLVISTVLSGIFPSLILSALPPVSVLKGKFSHSTSGIILRKGLVIVQFSIATFLLIQTFTATKQLNFMMNKDLGLDASKVVVVNAPFKKNQQDYISFRNSLLERPAFRKVGLSSTVPGMPTKNMGSTTNLNLDEDERDLKNNFFIYRVDSNFFTTVGIEILEGENFTKGINFQRPILINEEALRIWGISNPKDVIHKKMTFWGRENTIIGVVKNFHQLGPKSPHLAMMFSYSDNRADHISIKLGPGNVLEQIQDLEKIYQAHFSSSPFEFFFLDQNFNAQYRADRQFQKVFGILSGFAILITGLGLFGLASFTVAKRAKEIGIRKVLGASVSQLIALLSKDFITLVLASTVIALPVTYFIVKGWLEQYTFRIDLNIWLFIGPAFLVLIIAFATVFSKTFQVSNANPVTSLKDE